MSSGMNGTHIVLTPKTDHLHLVTQFRPIGLCHVIYKCVTKAIVQRLKPVFPKLISPTQGAFVPKRQITGNIVIVQEVLHTMRKKQGTIGYMTIKIDLKKAYDRLRWTFIKNTLAEMRFPLSLVEVIMHCVDSAKQQIL